MKNGARVLLELLQEHGIRVIFGYPGGAVISLYDELTRFPHIRHILVRHEQAAVHAADGYARATGTVGVCLATSGPGATNLVTGLATSRADSVPVVAITGQVATTHIGKDSFQEVDIVGITRSCTKHNYLVRDIRELPLVIREAFWVASSGRPGPVLIDIPKDVFSCSAPSADELREFRPRRNPPRLGHPLQIQRAATLLLQAERPVICVGAGAIHSGSSSSVIELAERVRAPVVSTFLGLGSFPASHPLWLGMLGMHGSLAANMAVTFADVLMVVGCRLDDRATGRPDRFAPHARVIHIDIDPSSIGKTVKAQVPIVGDARIVLEQILEVLRGTAQTEWASKEKWLGQVGEWKEKWRPKLNENGLIKPQQVVEQLSRLTSGRAIVSTDVGQHQMWTALHYQFQSPRTLLSSGGLGAMGYGLPAAIGAQVAFPDRLVVTISGDGSFQMNIQELATVASYGLPIKILVLRNGSLGMVRQWQSLLFEGRLSETLLPSNPDFMKVADAYGIKGLRATRPEEVIECLREGLQEDGPALMEFVVDPEEEVYPMVLPGKGLDEMVLGKDETEGTSSWAFTRTQMG